MSSSKHIIVLTSIISAVSLLIATVCILVDVFCMQKQNIMNYIIAIFSGIFASAMVVLLCESQKYIRSKHFVVNMLYESAILIYSQIIVMQSNVDQSLNSPTQPVVQNVLANCRNIIMDAKQHILTCDYNTFCNRKNVLLHALNKFRKSANQFDQILNESCIYYEIAIRTSMMLHLKNEGQEVAYGGDHYIQEVSKITLTRLEVLKKMCEELILGIDHLDKYQFSQRKQNISISYVESIKALELDEYINKYGRTFDNKD